MIKGKYIKNLRKNMLSVYLQKNFYSIISRKVSKLNIYKKLETQSGSSITVIDYSYFLNILTFIVFF